MTQDTTKALEVVQKMLAAFGKGDFETLKKTLSEDTVWVYHGVDGIPYNGTYQGRWSSPVYYKHSQQCRRS